MTHDEAAKQRNEMAVALLEVSESITPILDSADGMKAEMERRGWSPTAAEQVALTWLLGMVNNTFRA